MSYDPKDPRFIAAVDLLGRAGAKSFQIRYDDDPEPTVWMAVAEWKFGMEAAGGLTPLKAVMRLLDVVVDSGQCAHCGKPSAVTDDWENPTLLDKLICWFVYDPERETFRRSCEGETEPKGRMYTRDPETGERVGRNDPCPCRSGKKFKNCHGAPR